MKHVAHRGWAEGHDENTLAAFAQAAGSPAVSGVEFDVRRDPGSEDLLVTHDPPPHADAARLSLDAALAFLSGTTLELFVEVKEPGIVGDVIARLVAAGVAERSVVFAFAKIAASFPWSGERPVRLGAILVYPWHMRRFIEGYGPDVIFIGWDSRPWTRIAFRIWWSVFSLENLARRHARPVVVGIVQRAADLEWLSRRGVSAAIGDVNVSQNAPGVTARQL